MREIRQSGSEGGGGHASPYPYCYRKDEAAGRRIRLFFSRHGRPVSPGAWPEIALAIRRHERACEVRMLLVHGHWPYETSVTGR